MAHLEATTLITVRRITRADEKQRLRKIRTARVRLNRIAGLVQAESPRLLDVGCGIGAIMEAATQRGWTATGADVSQAVVDGCLGRGLNCNRIVDGLLPFPDTSFDIVTAWSVIEHVSDVRDALSEWRRVLKPGGILALDTSNCAVLEGSASAARYRGFWPHGHTYTFTPATLSRFLAETGFRVLAAPFVGKLTGNAFLDACYAVAYQTQYCIRDTLRLQKPFMLFAERIESVHGSKRVAA